ncbi:MAG: hypothetical protein IKU54_06160 [Oscillospiraceae bacterium]|nr:hypothetical protein [Oscillospiraceae bacterium]
MGVALIAEVKRLYEEAEKNKVAVAEKNKQTNCKPAKSAQQSSVVYRSGMGK